MKRYILTEEQWSELLECGWERQHEILNSLPELPGANDVVPTNMVTCPGCSGTGKDGSYSDGTACHFCKGAGKLLQLDTAKMWSYPSPAAETGKDLQFLREMLGRFDKMQRDTTQREFVRQMITDWIAELEERPAPAVETKECSHCGANVLPHQIGPDTCSKCYPIGNPALTERSSGNSGQPPAEQETCEWTSPQTNYNGSEEYTTWMSGCGMYVDKDFLRDDSTCFGCGRHVVFPAIKPGRK